MKKLLYVITILLISITTINVSALRTSRYEPTFEADTKITNGQIAIYFGWRGEDANKTTYKIEFDTNMLTLQDVVPIDDFKVKYHEEEKNGSKAIYSFTFESPTTYNEKLFGAIVFVTKDGFNVGKQSEFKVYEIYSYAEDGSKYRNEGYYINLKRESKAEMLAIRTDIETRTKVDRSINFIIPFVVIAIVLAILIVIAILLIPARKQENRKDKINAQLDPKNYPIPGVGPFPKMKKKTKKDIIEPEEKVIQPLKEFVSKSDEVNEELKNKDIEVDKDMFKTNPTKEGEGGLININPLAFDDGQDDILDDGSDDDNIDTL